MKRYTLEDHEAYRSQEDEKAAKEEEARRERTEKESGRRAWLADGGREADFEREQDEAPDVLTHGATEDLIASWTENMCRGPFGERWDEVGAEGPPEPTPPWH